MRAAVWIAGILTLGGLSFQAQAASGRAQGVGNATQTCEAREWHDHGRTAAEPREQTIAQADVDRIHASPNGGVIIHGTDRNDVLVHACVYATAPTDNEAKQLASQIQILKGPGQIESNGPHMDRDHHWSVSYEIWLPAHSSLDVATVNGGIHIEHVEGDIKANNVNGGMHLDGLGGEVHASTVNGGITVQLAGTKWSGPGIHASTVNGSVKFEVPDGYGAHVEASTVNGGVHCDFPISLQGSITKHLSFQLGGGGPEIRTSTVNGSIRFSKTA